MSDPYDAIVIGAGNAALAAAASAREEGVGRVLVMEKAGRELRGGNTHYSGGLFHHNYPGGSGLMSGAVFGRIAGAGAAKTAAGQ